MSGRNRRPSTSSVESADSAEILWKQESSVVKSVAKQQSSDDWPIFELRDAVVLNKDGKSFENALDVVTNGPFIVRGYLAIDDPAQKIHLLMRFRAPVPIEIRHCTLYSIGESDEGRPLVWVSGKGGWYEINPSPAYVPLYNKMCEATALYYNLIDIYASRPKRSGKKGKIPQRSDELAQVFHRYAIRVGDGATFEDVVERCKEHANFFICQFTQESSEVIDWRSTEFFKWMTSENALAVKDVESAIKNPRPLSQTPIDRQQRVSSRQRSAIAESGRSSSTEEVEPKTQPVRRSRSTNPREATRATAEPKSRQPGITTQATASREADDCSPFATVLAAFEEEASDMLQSKRGASVSGLLNRFYYKYKFPNFRNGTTGCHKIPVEEVIHFNATALLDSLEKRKYQASELYPWLKKLAKTKFRPIGLGPSEFPYRIQLREQRAFHSRKADSSLHAEQEGRLSGEGSATRPLRIGKRPGRPKGSKSSLRPMKSSKKRSHMEISSDTEQVKSTDRDGDDVMSDLVNEESADESSSSRSETGEDASEDAQQDAVGIAIRAEKIPSIAPLSHQGTWCCEQEGCDHIVRGGGEEEMQAMIEDHFQQHEEGMDRMQLALAESRGLLPISHLLEKIKKISQRSQPENSADAGSSVAPTAVSIKRKLVV